MAGTKKSKKTQSSKKSSTKKKTNSNGQESFLRSEFLIIGSFAIAVILFLSNFGLCGIIGEFLRRLQLGIFGIIGYALPFIIFVGTCFALSNRDNPIAPLKIASVIAGTLVLCGLAELIFGGSLEGLNIGDIFSRSSTNGTGGGVIGGLLVMLLGSLLGRIGCYVIFIVILILAIVCITERSLVGAVSRGGDKVYQYAKEDAGRRRVIREEKAEEKRRQRDEKVYGVNLNSTKLDEETPASGSAQGPLLGDEVRPDEYTEDTDHKEEGAGDIPENNANEFTGTIQFPRSYDEDDDTVPFDMTSEDPDLHVVRDIRTLGEMDMVQDDIHENNPESELVYDGSESDIFSTPASSRTIETASGKIIENDSDALQKELENRRSEASQTDDQNVAKVIEKKKAVKKPYKFPPLNLLKKGAKSSGSYSEQEYKDTAVKLQQVLRNFGVGVTVTNISCGPTVTRYELHPEQGVKVSKILSLADDIKLNLAASDIRIEAPIPGKSAVGIEVPNKENSTVNLRDLLESDEFKNSTSKLSFAVGKDISGQVVVHDIGKMPHLLIAGATGSGKSVCINTLIMSIIYKSSPEDVSMIMIDPKVVELSVYNGIPHLLIPVVTDARQAAGALNWAVAEMMDRYNKFAEAGVRDLEGYNEKVEEERKKAEEESAKAGSVAGEASDEETDEETDEEKELPEKLPRILIIIDELADLMMVAAKEVEDAIVRLAQLARAAGIHLVIATQRPSVNVITGLIKANVPSRIAFAVSSGVDSRTIIDMNGAEKLLGKGDMLFYPSGYPKPVRVQGAFVSDQEIAKVTDFLKTQDSDSSYSEDIEKKISAQAAVAGTNSAPAAAGSDSNNGRDEYFVQAGRFVIEKEKGSIGMLQRMFKIGFNRAARIMDQLADAGVVSEDEGTKARKVLMTMEEFEAMLENESQG